MLNICTSGEPSVLAYGPARILRPARQPSPIRAVQIRSADFPLVDHRAPHAVFCHAPHASLSSPSQGTMGLPSYALSIHICINYFILCRKYVLSIYFRGFLPHRSMAYATATAPPHVPSTASTSNDVFGWPLVLVDRPMHL